ncbi:MAG TPA: NAD+ synthase [bacterium]|nr:NAD+ synthase [bacterium]HPG45074.1 NAD+ synthase [bacterium]HPM97316.1 NAD+ synthase [bacterium]
MDPLRIALGQINCTVGDLEGNRQRILAAIERAKDQECDLIAFPELAITGYPPEDLLLRQQFVADQDRLVSDIARRVQGLICILGHVDLDHAALHNSAAVITEGRLVDTYHKINLPNYSVFDEERYFEAGSRPLILDLSGVRIGLNICEDIWIDNNVTEAEALLGGADLLLNLSASPYYVHKEKERLELLRKRAQFTGAAVAYVNLIGGQDELIFDGHSLIVHPNGSVLAAGAGFAEDFIVADIDIDALRQWRQQQSDRESRSKSFFSPFGQFSYVQMRQSIREKHIDLTENKPQTEADVEEQIYRALCLGIRDYVGKNGFKDVALGLSGGVDSALVAALASDALGPDHVVGIGMPSQYSSHGSIVDAEQLAKNLGIAFHILPIQTTFDETLAQLKPLFQDLPSDVTEENLQARIRGNLLMALSNKFSWLIMATGNKSETSVGYSTLYGDMVGALMPLKDVFKTMVYRLCRYRNRIAGYDLIPEATLNKPPSAELRPDQTDQDSLPPYDVLDAILELYVVNEKSIQEIVERGFDRDIVRKIVRWVYNSEYKRRQAPPGIKITPRAYGKDRRMPITNRYRE